VSQVEPETPIERRVLEHLRSHADDHEVLVIDPALADTADFCAHYGYAPEASANCIVVASRDEPPRVAAALVLATTRLDVNKRLRRLMEVRKLSFAPAALTAELTGMQIGGVTPFALPDDMTLYVDARVAELDRVLVGGGSRRLKIEVDPAVFVAMPNAQVVEDLAIASTTG